MKASEFSVVSITDLGIRRDRDDCVRAQAVSAAVESIKAAINMLLD